MLTSGCIYIEFRNHKARIILARNRSALVGLGIPILRKQRLVGLRSMKAFINELELGGRVTLAVGLGEIEWGVASEEIKA